MECKEVEIRMPEGYTRNVDVCTNAKLPHNIKGMTNKRDKILINKYLDDLHLLGISQPKLYVLIHEANHIKHPELSEYQIREMSDSHYHKITGERIDSTAYFSFLGDMKGTASFD